MYSVAFAWNILQVSVKFILSNVSFKVNVFLLTFCPEHLLL